MAVNGAGSNGGFIAIFGNDADLKKYVIESYFEVTDSRINDDHWDLPCSICKVTRGFQVIKRFVGMKKLAMETDMKLTLPLLLPTSSDTRSARHLSNGLFTR